MFFPPASVTGNFLMQHTSPLPSGKGRERKGREGKREKKKILQREKKIHDGDSEAVKNAKSW